MSLDYIDIHSHLNLSPLFENREVILEKMKTMNIGTITVGIDLETSEKAIAIAEENPEHCWAIVGIHPTNINEVIISEEYWNGIQKLAHHKKVVAIGETGLDYFRDQSEIIKQKQKEVFKKHITLAVEIGKPLMLHVRASRGTDDAYYDALTILQEMNYGGKADFHFFSGSVKCMQDIMNAGYMVSVDGPITFVNEYDEMIRQCPIEKLMVETDAPYAAPAPYRGKTCEPWMVGEVAQKVAEIKNISIRELQKKMMQNTKDFFSI